MSVTSVAITLKIPGTTCIVAYDLFDVCGSMRPMNGLPEGVVY